MKTLLEKFSDNTVATVYIYICPKHMPRYIGTYLVGLTLQGQTGGKQDQTPQAVEVPQQTAS